MPERQLNDNNLGTEGNRKFDKEEYAQYALQAENTIQELHKCLSNTVDPKEAAMILLRVALEFYDAEWCGILDIDNDVGVWTPFWWYNKELGAMAQSVLLQEFELMDGCGRWYECLQKQELVIIDDPEAIKEIYPEEYVLCQRLQVDYAISVPFWKGPKGFLVLKNPKRFQKQIGLLRMLTFALVSLINEYHLLESRKLTIISPCITNDTDVYITVLGDLKITTKAGVLSEDELKSPKISRLLVYLLMSRKSACSPREIVDALWPGEDVDNAVKNIKGLIYRLQHAFGLISEYRLIVSTTNGYQLNPKLNIFTDLHLFDKKWSIAIKAIDIEEKIHYLKKAVDLYRGPLFQSAKHEHWIMPNVVSLEMRYLGAVSELMKSLYQVEDYLSIQQYASKAMHLCPHSVDVYFWMIVAMHRLKHPEMARSELRMARCNLLPEEYEELAKRLEEQVQIILHP